MYKIANKKGLTLIEIVIALAIGSIIAGMITSFLGYNLRVFTIGDRQYNVQSEVRLASDYIVKHIRFTTALEFIDKPENPENPSSLNSGYNYLYVDSGKLYHFSTDGMNHQKFAYGGHITSHDILTANNMFIVSLTGNYEGREYSVLSETDLPNLALKNIGLGNQSGEAIRYIPAGQSIVSSYTVAFSVNQLVFSGTTDVSKQLNYTIIPSLDGHTSTWSSLDTNVAVISGNINKSTVMVSPGSTAGNTFIQVVIEKDATSLTANIPVYVLGNAPIVEIDQVGPLKLPVGSTENLSITSIIPSGDSIESVVWSSENATYVTVNNSGQVQAQAEGIDKTVYVYVLIKTASGGEASDGIAIEVIPATKIPIPPITVSKNGPNVSGVVINNGFPGATVKLYNNIGTVVREDDLNNDGWASFTNLTSLHPIYLIISKDGFDDSDRYDF